MTPSVQLTVIGSGATLVLDGTLIIAGYTGADVEQVHAHIEELAAIGVAPPPEVPMVYPVDWSLLTTGTSIDVSGGGTSGEVEPVFVRHRGAWYLGVGSDHTDRELERESVHESKKACPKPMSAAVIPLDVDPAGGAFDTSWGAIEVSSTIDGALYQKGALSAIRMPSDLLPRVTAAVPSDADLVVFCGTVPLVDGEFRFGAEFLARLSVPGIEPIGLAYVTTAGTPAA